MEESLDLALSLAKEFETEITFLTMVAGVIFIAHVIVYLTNSVKQGFVNLGRGTWDILVKVIRIMMKGRVVQLDPATRKRRTMRKLQVLPTGQEKEGSSRLWTFRKKQEQDLLKEEGEAA